jgi:putative addiction module component (TIGR02574 family)
MSPKADAVLAEAMKLSEDERTELAEQLLCSVSPEREAEIERTWADEAKRRMDAVRRGEDELVDGDKVLAALKQGKRP